MTTIIGIKLNDRINNSQNFQKILSNYGCIIKTRLGIHETDNKSCNPFGLIILELLDSNESNNLISDLKQINDIRLGIMEV